MSGPYITRESSRYFLTDRIRDEVDWRNTQLCQGFAPPPVQKPLPDGASLVPLPRREKWRIPSCELADAIAAYNQDLCDELIGVDGNDEFVVYLAPVGRVR